MIFAVPSNTRNLMAVAGTRSIALNWEPPQLTQGLILRYEIGIFSNLERRNFTSEGLSFTATGLTPFTNYTVEVAAVNRHGRGYPNTRQTVFTLEDG